MGAERGERLQQMSELKALIDRALAAARQAGEVILEHYAGDANASLKADSSPVTAADEAAEAVILKALAAILPAYPVIAAEAVARGEAARLAGDTFWLVDPLDGTREYIARNGEFTVNIALVRDRAPVLGVVLAPAQGRLWYGAEGVGAWRLGGEDGGATPWPITARRRPAEGAVAVASRSHRDADTEAFLAREGIENTVAAGSSLKFCLLAEGVADLYPRFGPTMEWDTAAGHAVLAAAGGSVRAVTGGDLRYQKPGFRNPGFVAHGAAGAAAS